MKAGDLLILLEKYRKIYFSAYHMGIVLGESEKDYYFGSKRLIVLWCNGEIDDYIESTLEGAWYIISHKES